MKGNWTSIALCIAVVFSSGCRRTEDQSKSVRKSDIRSAITALLTTGKPGKLGGFVIFGGKSEFDYVQYALLSDDLLLNWPTIQKGGKERLPAFEACLKTRGFTRLMSPDSKDLTPEQIHDLKAGQYAKASDGLYAHVGTDIETIRILTLLLMKDVFEVSRESEIVITLEPQG